MNGLERGAGEAATLTDDPEPDDGCSPVEEAGREEERDEDEELSSTVEEGEEAVLALDARPTDWISIERSLAHGSAMLHPPCQNTECDDGDDEGSLSVPKSQTTEGLSETEWDFQCPPTQSDNLA